MKRYAKHAAYAAIALVFLWTAAWMFVAQRIVREIDSWRAGQARAGVTLEWDSFDVKGWPFAWRAAVERPRAAGAGPARWTWSGDRLVASFAPWTLSDIRVRLPGAQRVAFGAGDLATTVELRAARPDALLVFDTQGKLARLELDFEALEGVVDGGRPIRARKLDAAFAAPGADAFDAKLLAQGVRLSEALPSLAAFGTDIARAEIVVQLRGPRAAGASFGAAVRAWRDAGGTLEVTALALDWGALRLSGDGTLALDERDRPLGAGTVRVAGWREAIDALQTARTIEPMPAAVLKAALEFLARVSGGEPGWVRVPIAAQDGRLSVHRIPVAPLPGLRLE
jgi:hypothetical protein